MLIKIRKKILEYKFKGISDEQIEFLVKDEFGSAYNNIELDKAFRTTPNKENIEKAKKLDLPVLICSLLIALIVVFRPFQNVYLGITTQWIILGSGFYSIRFRDWDSMKIMPFLYIFVGFLSPLPTMLGYFVLSLLAYQQYRLTFPKSGLFQKLPTAS